MTFENNYGLWYANLIRMRDECRNRNARISGKKAQLVEPTEMALHSLQPLARGRNLTTTTTS